MPKKKKNETTAHIQKSERIGDRQNGRQTTCIDHEEADPQIKLLYLQLHMHMTPVMVVVVIVKFYFEDHS